MSISIAEENRKILTLNAIVYRNEGRFNFAYDVLRLHRNLNHPIQFVFEDAVRFLDILQLIAVGDQRQCIDLVCFNEGENLGTVAAVEPARPELL